MKKLLFALLLIAFTGSAQTISYYNTGLLRQPSAQADRDYLGITNLTAFSTNALWATTATNWLGSNALFLIVLQVNANATNNDTVVSNALVTFTGTNSWKTTGNAGLPMANPVFGTLDNKPINLVINGIASGKLNTDKSIALGNLSTASAATAIGIGNLCNSAGIGSVAIGTGSTGSGDFGTAVGPTATAATYASAFGYNAYAAARSIAIGESADSAAANAVAIGFAAFAQNASSVAIGDNAYAAADSAMAFGNNTVANNSGSAVFNDATFSGYSDSVANQFVAYFSGGADFNTAGAGFHADFYTHYRAGNVSVPALATSKAITFSSALASANYAPVVTAGFALGAITMYVDTLTVNGFTVHFSAAVGGGTLHYNATLNQ